MKNSSYYIAPVGVRTHGLPHTVASNMGKVSYALTHSATAAVIFSNRIECDTEHSLQRSPNRSGSMIE